MGFQRAAEDRWVSRQQLLFRLPFFQRASLRKGKTFNEAYRAKFQAEPPPLAALAYDAVWLVADALKRSGSAEPAALRDALSGTKDFPGVTGTVTMGEDRNPKKPAVVIRIQDGKFTYLESAEP